MGEAENHLGISHQKMNFSGQGRFRYNQLLAKEIPVETPKQSRLLSRLLIAPHKLMIMPYCWKQNLHNFLRSSALFYQEPPPSQTNVQGIGRCSACATKGERWASIQIKKPLIYNGDQHASWCNNDPKLVGVSNKIWFVSNPTPWDRTHTWSCLCGQEPESRLVRELRYCSGK